MIIGSSRVWYSEDFGTTWVTLPGATAPPAGNLGHDGFGQKITVCRWQGTEVAWVLGEGRLKRYARTAGSDTAGGPGAWTAEVIIEKGVKAKKDTTTTDGPIRDSAVWTDIAVNLDRRRRHRRAARAARSTSAPSARPPTTRSTRCGGSTAPAAGTPPDCAATACPRR